MREVTSAVLVGAMWITFPVFSAAQVKISGGGEYKDQKGIHVRAYSTFPSLVRLAEGKLLCYDMASRDEGRTWSRHREFGFPLSDATRPRRGSVSTLKDGTTLPRPAHTNCFVG